MMKVNEIIARWSHHESSIGSTGDLRLVVDAVLRSGEPTMLFLEAPNGNILVVGVGHDESVLTFFSSDGRSFHSLGDPERKGYLRFLSRDTIDEFMKEMAVPSPVALGAAEEFVATRERPGGLRWEADW